MKDSYIGDYSELPAEAIKIIIDEIYNRYGEKTSYVGIGKRSEGLFTKYIECYYVQGSLSDLFINRGLFLGNGPKTHYFIKQKSNIKITKIIL